MVTISIYADRFAEISKKNMVPIKAKNQPKAWLMIPPIVFNLKKTPYKQKYQARVKKLKKATS